MTKYQHFMALEAPARTRPVDYSGIVARLNPSGLIAYVTRFSRDARHHWNDPTWTMGVDLSPMTHVPEICGMHARAAYLQSVAKPKGGES